ncbi:CLUMA_CG021038, isoform A [Clunio marinus]|uniref:CLUMA_CG021038, isoform A n=1 Tax=Clunio marinus TaxID=568069 RepID=A0A1J1J750_9DIPT|nr:CLUMA_CG021038, isoform A [Clunio marinus]
MGADEKSFSEEIISEANREGNVL